jgi:CrcB protein
MNAAGSWPGTMAAIAIGAVLGAWARWGLGLWLNRPDAAVPGGTLMANLVGGLLIGIFLALVDRRPEWAALRPLLVTGFLGALTTFSTFSAESLQLLQRGAFAQMALHSALHLVGSVAASAVGFKLMR